MSLQKPTLDVVKDPSKLYALLAGLYESAVALGLEVAPVRSPKLKAITIPTFTELRLRRGDTLGELGPRVCLVAGKATPLDAYAGIFVWDPTSILADDEANTIVVSNVPVGRWRRLAVGAQSSTAVADFGASETDLATVVVTGQTWVTATSNIVATLGAASADHDVEDGILEEITLAIGDRVAGVGYTIYAHAPNGTWGQYNINVVGAP